MEQAYGSNPDKWNMKNPNIVAAQLQFQRHYIRYMYNPRDQFSHAASLLGGSNNNEVRERIVQLMEAPTNHAHSRALKDLKRAMIRTASQEFFRCFDKAKTLSKERNAEKVNPLCSNLIVRILLQNLSAYLFLGVHTPAATNISNQFSIRLNPVLFLRRETRMRLRRTTRITP